jgi:hypothetical protein
VEERKLEVLLRLPVHLVQEGKDAHVVAVGDLVGERKGVQGGQIAGRFDSALDVLAQR